MAYLSFIEYRNFCFKMHRSLFSWYKNDFTIGIKRDGIKNIDLKIVSQASNVKAIILN